MKNGEEKQSTLQGCPSKAIWNDQNKMLVADPAGGTESWIMYLSQNLAHGGQEASVMREGAMKWTSMHVSESVGVQLEDICFRDETSYSS